MLTASKNVVFSKRHFSTSKISAIEQVVLFFLFLKNGFREVIKHVHSKGLTSKEIKAE